MIKCLSDNIPFLKRKYNLCLQVLNFLPEDFFLLFSEKTAKKFRSYKNSFYICCEMKPCLF